MAGDLRILTDSDEKVADLMKSIKTYAWTYVDAIEFMMNDIPLVIKPDLGKYWLSKYGAKGSLRNEAVVNDLDEAIGQLGEVHENQTKFSGSDHAKMGKRDLLSGVADKATIQRLENEVAVANANTAAAIALNQKKDDEIRQLKEKMEKDVEDHKAVLMNTELIADICPLSNLITGSWLVGFQNLLQVILFFFSIYLVEFAQGGYKPCVQAFGADQFDGQDPKECKAKSSFFNWWYFCICAGTIEALLGLIYIQDNLSWGLGFGIPCIMMVVALIIFLLGTRSYRFSVKAEEKSVFRRIGQVFLVALRNWRTSPSAIALEEEARGTLPHKTSEQFNKQLHQPRHKGMGSIDEFLALRECQKIAQVETEQENDVAESSLPQTDNQTIGNSKDISEKA
ncbi:protein NRT1/ PTR FAMILY 5.10-like [Euphorbia lathyris]|uniref:protein NRT1/ PTR FAMILY 5.10-like n=1 Tax=Euphorbia lathyris TaxID=212925 RepID=UPI0033140428